MKQLGITQSIRQKRRNRNAVIYELPVPVDCFSASKVRQILSEIHSLKAKKAMKAMTSQLATNSTCLISAKRVKAELRATRL